MRLWHALAVCRVLTGCAEDTIDDSGVTGPFIDYSASGAYTPARHTSVVLDAARGRTLNIETWYPADSAPVDSSVLELVVDESDRAAYQDLLAAAPVDCPTLTTIAVVDAVPLVGAWPVIGMSHCHECTRFSTVSVAERLASHGFVVVAPDHAGNTLFDALRGDALPLDTDTLALRAGDLAFALSETLAAKLVPELETDSTRVGVFGHSFGAVTAGLVLQEQLGQLGGPVAGMFVGAPPENPFLAGVAVETLVAPLLFETLAEDHSVGAAGNLLIENNFAEAPSTAWHFVLADAGHWSPSDLVGLTEDFMPGCGSDNRQAAGEAFEYLDPLVGRNVTASLAAGFFGAYVAKDSQGDVWLAAAMDQPGVTAARR